MNEPTHSLQDFLNETAECNRPGKVFEVEQVGRDGRLSRQPDLSARSHARKRSGQVLMKIVSGGLFSAKLSGSGMVAIMSHSKPLTLKVTPDDPVSTNPNATVAWSGDLLPEIRIDASLRSLVGRGGGETFQMVFRGTGFVVMQPFEESPLVTVTGG